MTNDALKLPLLHSVSLPPLAMTTMQAPAAVPSFAGLRPRRSSVAARAPAAASHGRRSLVVRAAVARETDPKKRIVITGMGLCSVFGNDPDTFYEKLLAGTSGISMIDRFDTSDYPTRFAGQIKNFRRVRVARLLVAGACVAGAQAARGRAIRKPWAAPWASPARRHAALTRPGRRRDAQLRGLHRQEERPAHGRLPALRTRVGQESARAGWHWHGHRGLRQAGQAAVRSASGRARRSAWRGREADRARFETQNGRKAAQTLLTRVASRLRPAATQLRHPVRLRYGRPHRLPEQRAAAADQGAAPRRCCLSPRRR